MALSPVRPENDQGLIDWLRGLGPLEGVGAAGEIVLLDVDDDEATRHGGSKPGQTNRAQGRPIPQ